MADFIYNNIVLFSAFVILGLMIINLEIKNIFGATKNISCDSLVDILNNSNVLLIDIRGSEEYNSGHIVGAKNYTLDQLDNLKLDMNNDAIITYANDERVAVQAANKIVKLGATKVFYLEGGLSSWVDSNMPLSGEK